MEHFSHDFSNLAVFIGRFQPFHNGHLRTLDFALSFSETVVLVLGGYRLSPSLKNPWSAAERIEMISAALSPGQLSRVRFACVRDRLYCEDLWKSNVVQEVMKHRRKKQKTVLVGHEKDATSYYLSAFPDWSFVETGNYGNINATNIRQRFFLTGEEEHVVHDIPGGVYRWLWNYRSSNQFLAMQKAFQKKNDIDAEKKEQKKKQEVINVLVKCGGALLLVKRFSTLPRPFYSLPELGIEDKKEDVSPETIWTCLQKESGIRLSPEQLRDFYRSEKTFASSGRNPYAQETSHTFFYEIPSFRFPKISPLKNGNKVVWLFIEDLYLRENLFEKDHFQIIQWFLGRYQIPYREFQA